MIGEDGLPEELVSDDAELRTYWGICYGMGAGRARGYITEAVDYQDDSHEAILWMRSLSDHLSPHIYRLFRCTRVNSAYLDRFLDRREWSAAQPESYETVLTGRIGATLAETILLPVSCPTCDYHNPKGQWMHRDTSEAYRANASRVVAERLREQCPSHRPVDDIASTWWDDSAFGVRREPDVPHPRRADTQA